MVAQLDTTEQLDMYVDPYLEYVDTWSKPSIDCAGDLLTATGDFPFDGEEKLVAPLSATPESRSMTK